MGVACRQDSVASRVIRSLLKALLRPFHCLLVAPGGEAGIRALADLLGVEALPLNPECGEERPRRVAVIDESVCIGCTLCIQACPVDAILGAPLIAKRADADLLTDPWQRAIDQADRLRPGDPDYLQLARTQMSIVDKLTRIYDLCARVAQAAIPQATSIAA